MNKMENKCEVCAEKLIKLTKCKDKYHYYICSNCSLVTSLPLPSDKTLTEYYQGFLFHKPTEEELILQKELISENVRGILLDIMAIKSLNKNTTMLDYGGGVGIYSNSFAKYFKTYYYDIDNEAKKYAEDNLGVNAINNINEDGQKFDIIFCNNVIEHVKHPKKFISNLKDMLNKDGILIITTPNQKTKEYFVRWIWLYVYLKFGHFNIKQFVKHPWIACDPPRHLYSFNEDNMRIMAEKNKMEVIKCHTEYETSKTYNEKSTLHRINSLRDLRQNIYTILRRVAIPIVKLFDKQNKFGHLLVVIMKK